MSPAGQSDCRSSEDKSKDGEDGEGGSDGRAAVGTEARKSVDADRDVGKSSSDNLDTNRSTAEEKNSGDGTARSGSEEAAVTGNGEVSKAKVEGQSDESFKNQNDQTASVPVSTLRSEPPVNVPSRPSGDPKCGTGDASSPILVKDDVPKAEDDSQINDLTKTPNNLPANQLSFKTLIDNVLDKSLQDSPPQSPRRTERDSVESDAKPAPEDNSDKKFESAKISLAKKGRTFKDHLEKVLVDNFYYGYVDRTDKIKSESDGGKLDSKSDKMDSDKKDSLSRKQTSDSTVSVQDIVDRVISETENFSKMIVPTESSKFSTAGKGSDSLCSSGSLSKPARNLIEQQRYNVNKEYQSSTVGRRRGRPRLSSPSNSAGNWPVDASDDMKKSPGMPGYHHPSRDGYRGLPGVPRHPADLQNRPGYLHPRVPQAPPPLDFAPHGSIQHGMSGPALMAAAHSGVTPYHNHLAAQRHPHSASSPSSKLSPHPQTTPPVSPLSSQSGGSAGHFPHHRGARESFQHQQQSSSHQHHLTSRHSSHAQAHLSSQQQHRILSQQQQQLMSHPSHHPNHHHSHSQHSSHPPPPHTSRAGQHGYHSQQQQQSHHPNAKPPPLILANDITSERPGSDGGGSSRLVPVSHMPTKSCSCHSCAAHFARDKSPSLKRHHPNPPPPGSHTHKAHDVESVDAGLRHRQPYPTYPPPSGARSSKDYYAPHSSEPPHRPVVSAPQAAIIPGYSKPSRPRSDIPNPGPPQSTPGYGHDQHGRYLDHRTANVPSVHYPGYPPHSPAKAPHLSGKYSSESDKAGLRTSYPPNHPGFESGKGQGDKLPPPHVPEVVKHVQAAFPPPPVPLGTPASVLSAPVAAAGSDQPLDLSVKPSPAHAKSAQSTDVYKSAYRLVTSFTS